MITDLEKLTRLIFEGVKRIYFAEKPTHQGTIPLLYRLFILMIVVQNFMLISNHIKSWD